MSTTAGTITNLLEIYRLGGDAAVEEALWHYIKPNLQAIARYLTWSFLDASEGVDDVVQESAVRVFNQLKGVSKSAPKNRETLRLLFWRVTRDQATNLYRRRRTYAEHLKHVREAMPNTDYEFPEREAIVRETYELVLNKHFDKRDQRVMKMALADCKTDEIAHIDGRSRRTMQSILRKFWVQLHLQVLKDRGDG